MNEWFSIDHIKVELLAIQVESITFSDAGDNLGPVKGGQVGIVDVGDGQDRFDVINKLSIEIDF